MWCNGFRKVVTYQLVLSYALSVGLVLEVFVHVLVYGLAAVLLVEILEITHAAQALVIL